MGGQGFTMSNARFLVALYVVDVVCCGLDGGLCFTMV